MLVINVQTRLGYVAMSMNLQNCSPSKTATVSILDKLEDNKVPLTYSVKVIPYVHIPGEIGYQATSVVVKNENNYEKLKQKAYRDLLYWKEKYSMIVELEDIFKAIEYLKI